MGMGGIYLCGGVWWVQVMEWGSIVREGGGGDGLVCQCRHKHSSIEVLYNILN